MRRSLLIGLAVVLVLLVGGATYVLWPRGGTPVSEEEALAAFRELGGADDGEHDDLGSRPAAGVYTYDAEGEEQVKLGVLPTEDRSLPASVTAVLVQDDDDCFTLTLNLLAQHAEDTTYCSTPEGVVTLAEHAKHQQVGPLSPDAVMACDPDTLIDPDEAETELACTLSLSGGPARLTASLVGTSRLLGLTTVEVDGEQIDAIELQLDYDVSGDLDGSWSEHLWLHEQTGMPLRIERALDLQGLATFSERSDLLLQSLDPRR